MSQSVEDLLLAALSVERLLRAQKWQFCFIGGIAIQRWGEPRFTRDIDLTLLTGFGNEEVFVDGLLHLLEPRIPEARQFALRHRVLLARTSGGVEVDVALGALPFEERTISRASPWTIRDKVALTTCSCEDLLTHKVFAGRAIDWGDAERILVRQHGKIDLEQVRAELSPLLDLKGQAEALAKFDELIGTVERRLR